MPPRTLIRSSRARARKPGLLPDNMRSALARLTARFWGGLIMLAAIGIALALFSYNPQDPSWNTSSSMQPHNWLGSVGGHGADLVWQAFGVGGFLSAIVLAAWGWRVATGRGLDYLPWRILAVFFAMFACGTGIAALEIHTMPDTPSLGGAFGGLTSAAITGLLPSDWGRYAYAFVMLIIMLVTLYIAAALTFGEWGGMLQIFHSMAMWVARGLHSVAQTFRHILHREDNDAEENEDRRFEIREREEPPEEVETDEEKEPKSEKRAAIAAPEPPKRVKVKVRRPAASARQARLPLRPESDMALPPLDLLQWPESARNSRNEISEEALEKNAKLLESVLGDFGVNGTITKVSPGPVVTLYELEPSPGTRAARVISLADDIARNMSAASVRVAVVPGRNVIGIELPNARRETVYLRELLSTETYNDAGGLLPLVLGKDIAGMPIIADMARMPHLLIAGTTGSGKSVAINTMILSLLYRLPPQKCRFIMIDPKMLELSVYEGIPHLLAPVVTEPKKAIMALRWTVREMEERYRAMSKLGVRNIEGYNARLREASKNGENLTRTVQTGFDRETGKPIYEEQPLDLTELPIIVVVVDEMADLMIVAGKEIEGAIQRLAQMARAAGIHILMATQRPSVDVITGTIKANFPTRISFQVTSKIDSRTILGEQGAEQLLGQGDMLFMAGGGRVTRVHGPFVRDDEVEAVVKFLKSQGEPEYLDEVTEDDGQGEIGGDSGGSFGGGNGNSGDELYDKAVDIVLREQKASTSFLQRHLQLGYNKAATLIERMEKEGLISQATATGKREIYGKRGEE